jgi:hypothetical protein
MNDPELNSEITNKQAEDLKDSIDFISSEVPDDVFYEITSTELLSAYNIGNTSALKSMLADQNKSTELRSKYFSSLKFFNPIYVVTVGFLCDGDAAFEIEYTDFNKINRVLDVSSKNKDGRHVVSIKEFVLSIGIRVKKVGVFDKKKRAISGLKIYALTMEQSSEIVKDYLSVKDDRANFESKITQHKDALQSIVDDITSKRQSFDSYIQSKEQEIEDLEEQKGQLTSEAEEQNQVLSDAKSQIADKNIEIKSLDDRIIALNQEEVKKKSTISTLQKEHVDLNNKYLALQKNVNLLPDTLDGFSQRSFKNKRSYLLLSSIPLLVLGFIVYMAWGATKDLATKSPAENYEQAFSILIQRMPFSLLFLFLVGMCISFLYKMVNQLTEVHQQELNLAKISMLARDMSDSETIDLDEEERQEKRIEVKMKLIQQYLASEFMRYETLKDKNSEKHSLFGSLNVTELLSGLGIRSKEKTESESKDNNS